MGFVCLIGCFIFVFMMRLEGVESNGNPDCDFHQVVMNVNRICKSYAYIKRSTPDDLQGGMGNEIQMQWQLQPTHDSAGRPLIAMSSYGIPNQNVWRMGQQGPDQSYYQPQQQGQGQYLQRPEQYSVQQDRQQPPPESLTKESDLEDLFNPVYYAGGESQTTLERWRRNQRRYNTITDFLRNKCCVKGCGFPKEFLELERRTNICNFR